METAIRKIGARGVQRYVLMFASLMLGLIACQFLG
jgi:hypothetical protein